MIAQGTKDYESTFSWRFPIAFNLLIVIVIGLGTFFVPESPRWLTSKYRDEKALKSLEAVHKKDDDTDPESELRILQDARKAEAENSEPGSWSDLLHGADRRRFICAFGILCCQQISGVQFICMFISLFRVQALTNYTVSYATIFFENIGLNNAFLFSTFFVT